MLVVIADELMSTLDALCNVFFCSQLSGPLFIPASSTSSLINALNVALQSGVGFTCPLFLDNLLQLQLLDLHGAGFTGCDFTNPFQVRLPTATLLSLDIGQNQVSGSSRSSHD